MRGSTRVQSGPERQRGAAAIVPGARLLLVALGFLLLPLRDASAATVLTPVAAGLDRPVYLTAPPGDGERVFLLEQHTGRIRILRLLGNRLLPTPFLTLTGVSTGNEQGLLGLAFDPDYATNGRFYVHYNDPDSRIVRFRVSADPDVADPTSAIPILTVPQPQHNHNGGWIGFGADDLLYVALGDGGNGSDSGPGHTEETGNAQDLTENLLGKILRIDPSADDFPEDPERNYAIPLDNPFVGTTADDEIWVYGLRNPWRASFDRATGDLYIADVGQSACEEIDVQPVSSSGGENYGWRRREGGIATPTGGVGGSAPGAIDPILDYPHANSTCSDPGMGMSGISITGGYVYRGPATELDGRYFFADFGAAQIWSLVWDGTDPAFFDGSNFTELTAHSARPALTALGQATLDTVTSFGEDAAGRLYVLDLDGDVFRLPEPEALAQQGIVLASLLALRAIRRRARGRGCRLQSRTSRATLAHVSFHRGDVDRVIPLTSGRGRPCNNRRADRRSCTRRAEEATDARRRGCPLLGTSLAQWMRRDGGQGGETCTERRAIAADPMEKPEPQDAPPEAGRSSP